MLAPQFFVYFFHPAKAARMPFVKDGKIVEKESWSLSGFFLSFINILRLFILTIFTGESTDTHVNQYKATKGSWGSGGGKSGKGPNINTFAKPASAGCAGGGGG